MSARRPVWVLALLALCVAALVLSAFDAERAVRPAMPSRIGAPVEVRPGPPARVAYTGPRPARGHRDAARARAAGRRPDRRRHVPARRAAARNRHDGAVRLDVDASLFAAGRHRLQVEAVDRLGRRTAGPRRCAWTRGARPARHDARRPGSSPRCAALARGDVTVRLAAGALRGAHAALGSGARLVGSGPRHGARRHGRRLVARDGARPRRADRRPDDRRRRARRARGRRRRRLARRAPAAAADPRRAR